MFWDAKKTAGLKELYAGKLEFLQNNYYAYEDYALVGTRGYTFEGPLYLDGYGHVCGWDEKEAEQVIYGHCHGESRFHDSIRGEKHGIRYSLVSGDCLRRHPMKVL